MCIVYLYAAFHKLNIGYLSGKVLEHYLSRDFRTGLAGDILEALFSDQSLSMLHGIMLSPQTLIVLSVLTVVFELGLPIALWFRRRGLASA